MYVLCNIYIYIRKYLSADYGGIVPLRIYSLSFEIYL